jgi:hypothetical protein
MIGDQTKYATYISDLKFDKTTTDILSTTEPSDQQGSSANCGTTPRSNGQSPGVKATHDASPDNRLRRRTRSSAASPEHSAPFRITGCPTTDPLVCSHAGTTRLAGQLAAHADSLARSPAGHHGAAPDNRLRRRTHSPAASPELYAHRRTIRCPGRLTRLQPRRINMRSSTTDYPGTRTPVVGRLPPDVSDRRRMDPARHRRQLSRSTDPGSADDFAPVTVHFPAHHLALFTAGG